MPTQRGMDFDLSWASGASPDDFRKRLSTFGKIADEQFFKVTEDAKDDVVRIAKREVPVDTGKLRDSIAGTVKTEGDNIVVLIGSPVEYAGFVEYGTGHAPAQPYMRPALEEGLSDYQEEIAAAVARAAGDAGGRGIG